MPGFSASLRALTDQRRFWVMVGRVHVEEKQPKHWAVEDGELLVSVLLDDHEIPVWALLGMLGGLGQGAIRIPPPDTEVLVAFTTGEVEGVGVIVATLPTTAVPDGLRDDATLIIDAKVLVYDGSGTPEPVVLKSEFLAHVHGTGVGPSSTPTEPIQGSQVLETM